MIIVISYTLKVHYWCVEILEGCRSVEQRVGRSHFQGPSQPGMIIIAAVVYPARLASESEHRVGRSRKFEFSCATGLSVL